MRSDSRPRWAWLRSQGLGLVCGFATVLLFAIGSVVISATRDGASSAIHMDDLRGFFEITHAIHIFAGKRGQVAPQRLGFEQPRPGSIGDCDGAAGLRFGADRAQALEWKRQAHIGVKARVGVGDCFKHLYRFRWVLGRIAIRPYELTSRGV